MLLHLLFLHSLPIALYDANYQVNPCDATEEAKAARQRKHASEASAEKDNKDEGGNDEEEKEFFDFVGAPEEKEAREVIERCAFIFAHVFGKLGNLID